MNKALAAATILFSALFAGSYYGLSGLVLGALSGLAFTWIFDVRARIAALEREMRELRELARERSTMPESRMTDAPYDAREMEAVPAHALTEEFILPDLEGIEGGPKAEVVRIPGAAFGTETPKEGGQPLLSDPAQIRKSHPIFQAVNNFLYGGNLLVKTGIFVLFIGVAFLVKYASDRQLLPIELRLAGAALVGMTLLALGWRFRMHTPIYGLSLQGGGTAILYLVVFSAFRIYGLVPAGLALTVLVALCALSAVLAVLQDSLSLAVLGAAGGFLAPIVTSTGQGSHVMLFSYYALLNCGILGIAWFRAWRLLNLVGFGFTFGIGAVWGYRYYSPEYLASTEPFLILFFLLYVSIAVLFALRQPPHLKGYLDGTIVFGTPIIVFSQQAALLRSNELTTALCAVGFGLFYCGLAWVLLRWKQREMRLLSEAFLSIGVAFGTVAIPLSFEARGIASAWALEGAALVWVGARHGRVLARTSGLLLQLGAGMALMPYVLGLSPLDSQLPVLNRFCLGAVLIALSGLFSSYTLYRYKKAITKWEGEVSSLVGIWALTWWFGAGLLEMQRHIGPTYHAGSILLFISISCTICRYAKERLDWPLIGYAALGLLPMMAAVAAMIFSDGAHPFAGGGFASWPFAFAALYWILYRSEDLEDRILHAFHADAFWLIAALVAWESSWQAGYWTGYRGSWEAFATGFSLSALIMLGITFGVRLSWPVQRHLDAYMAIALGPVALAASFWAVFASLKSNGDPWPLAYIPLLNPLEISTGLALAAPIAWLLRQRTLRSGNARSLFDRVPVGGLVCASVFIWLNSILVRCVHYWGGVPFASHAMMKSILLQASLSIFWSLTALFIMVFSTRRRIRRLWLTGAALLAAVVVKLFLIDLAGTGTVERIISFVGVGILILVIGYLSPVPPQDKEVSPVK